MHDNIIHLNKWQQVYIYIGNSEWFIDIMHDNNIHINKWQQVHIFIGDSAVIFLEVNYYHAWCKLTIYSCWCKLSCINPPQGRGGSTYLLNRFCSFGRRTDSIGFKYTYEYERKASKKAMLTTCPMLSFS